MLKSRFVSGPIAIVVCCFAALLSCSRPSEKALIGQQLLQQPSVKVEVDLGGPFEGQDLTVASADGAAQFTTESREFFKQTSENLNRDLMRLAQSGDELGCFETIVGAAEKIAQVAASDAMMEKAEPRKHAFLNDKVEMDRGMARIVLRFSHGKPDEVVWDCKLQRTDLKKFHITDRMLGLDTLDKDIPRDAEILGRPEVQKVLKDRDRLKDWFAKQTDEASKIAETCGATDVLEDLTKLTQDSFRGQTPDPFGGASYELSRWIQLVKAIHALNTRCKLAYLTVVTESNRVHTAF